VSFEIPIFPLNVVLFPGGVLPLRVFEARYVDMTRDCMKSGKPFGVALIREGGEVGAAAVPEAVGTTAVISDWDMQQLGVLNLTTVGQDRFRILSSEVAANGLITASVEKIPEEPCREVPPENRACASLLRAIVAQVHEKLLPPPHHFNDAAWVGYRLSELLPIPLAAKQKLLELDGSISRLQIITKYLEQNGLAIRK
jgi:Lon protease-like protein